MDEILASVHDGVALVTFNRPQARNAFTLRMYDRLHALCGELAAGGGVRAIVFRGAGGRAFAAGTEIAEFETLRSAADSERYERGMEALLAAIEALPVPTIAAVAGACTGGGFLLACACDLRIAAANARFGLPMARTLGNCLSVRNLARAVDAFGEPAVRDMLLTARLYDARSAQALGFVRDVVDDAEQAAERARQLAAEIASYAPLTVRAAKEGLRRRRAGGRDAEDADLLDTCYLSDDFREGVDAFVERREPRWTGR